MIIWFYILKTKVTKEDLVKDKDKNERAMNSQSEDENYMDSSLVKDKDNTCPSESAKDTKIR